jgi:unsaturated rhamnogalacturonyl hydrolase
MNRLTNNDIIPKINLVVSKLMHLGEIDFNNDKTASKESLKKGLIARDFGIKEWDWPQGVGLYGLISLQQFHEDSRFDAFLEEWFLNNIEIGLPSKNINTTAPYLALLDYGIRKDNQIYLNLCYERAQWLMNDLPKTTEGGFQHVTSAIGDRNGIILNEEELWVDTLFMAVLFLNKMGHHYNRKDWISEANNQLLIHIKYLYDTKTSLFYHGWTFKERSNFGEIFWCRGNSWFTFGLLEFLETSDLTLDEGLKTFFLDTFKAQALALKHLQSSSGLWHTVLDDPTSYEEVSGSAAIAKGFLKGVKLGILDNSYETSAYQAIECICENIAIDGTVLQVSAGTGMGMDADHYKNILTVPMAYGQSLVLVALSEALKK